REELEEGQEDLQQMLLHRRCDPRPIGPTKRVRRLRSVLELSDPPVETANELLDLVNARHHPTDGHLSGHADPAHGHGPAAGLAKPIRGGRDDPLLGLPTFPCAELNLFTSHGRSVSPSVFTFQTGSVDHRTGVWPSG